MVFHVIDHNGWNVTIDPFCTKHLKKCLLGRLPRTVFITTEFWDQLSHKAFIYIFTIL